jgi:hypothetical protein
MIVVKVARFKPASPRNPELVVAEALLTERGGVGA